jgi:hypothetical protein
LEPLNSIKDLRPYKIKKIVFDIYIWKKIQIERIYDVVMTKRWVNSCS